MAYQKGDSLRALILNQASECVAELYFFQKNTKAIELILYHKESRLLNQEEKKLLTAKRQFLAEVSEDKYQISAAACCELQEVLVPYEKGYKFYLLSLTNQDSILPLGGDYLFKFNHALKLQSWNELHKFKKYSNKHKDLPPNAKIAAVSMPCGGENGNYIQASDICKFRLYGKNLDLEEFKTNCNKRAYTYNRRLNIVQIHLFPSERK